MSVNLCVLSPNVPVDSLCADDTFCLGNSCHVLGTMLSTL